MKTAFSKKTSKHAKEHEKSQKTKIVRFIVLLAIIILIGATIYLIIKNNADNKSENNTDNSANNIVNEDDEEITMIEDGQANEIAEGEANSPAYESDFPDEIGGYRVIGQVVIDKVGIKRSILEKTTNKSLKLAPTWFDGPSPNKVGNMTITGHNNSTQFRALYDLSVGDTLYVIDKETNSKVTYKIYDIFTVKPDDTDYVLSQKTNGKREVTLVTCNPGGLTRRIYKAREV